MKKYLLPCFFLLCSIHLISQDSKLSLELNYPLPLGENFINRFYFGVADIGLKYRIFEYSFFNLGAGYSTSIIRQSDDLIPFDVTLFTFQPKLFIELDWKSIKRVHPYLGVGYSILWFYSREEMINGVTVPADSNTRWGANPSAEILVDLTKKLFLQVQYDFIFLTHQEGTLDIRSNNEVQFIKFGLGIRPR